MDGCYRAWNNKCISALIVVILIQILNISGTNSQNIDQPRGPLIHSGKEPPDIPDTETNQQTFVNLRSRNSGRGNQRINQRPMIFLCSSRIPLFVSRRNIPAQTTASPFIITVTRDITKNKLLHVKISSTEEQTFRGFMIQVLSSSAAAEGKIVGEFLPSPDVNLQSCYARDDTATSGDKMKKMSALATWQAPADLKESVIVRATVIQSYQRYWTDLLSDELKLEDISTHSSTIADNEIKDTSIAKDSENVDDNNDDTVNLNDKEANDLEKSIAETFEGFSGPLESPDEVLLHQGIMEVNKVDENRNKMSERFNEPGIIIKPPSFDEAPTAPLPPPRYVYRTMNQYAPNFEPPQASEFMGNLLKSALGVGGGNPVPGAVSGGGSSNGLGSMMNMMGMASNLFGGGGNSGGGGGMMKTLGTMSKLSGMLGGGNRRPPASGGGMGGLGSLGALSSLGSMLGGGGGSPLGAMLGGGARNVGNTGPAPTGGGGGLGGLGALSSLLGGIGNKNKQAPPTQNVAPIPSGAPVNPARNDEPSLADLLGVDPSIAMDSSIPTVVPAEANPLAGISAAKAGGGLMSKIGGFAPMLAMAPIAFNMFGSKKKKQQQQMPFGQQQGQFGQRGGQPGQFGAPGMPPGAPGQFGMPGRPAGQFGMPPSQGQFPGMPGQFGMPPFGPTQPPTTPAPKKDDDIQKVLQLLEAQRLQIEALKNQIGGASITSQMGGFGNIPISFGQSTGSQLLGLSDQNGLSNFGTSLSTFEPAGPPKQVTQQPQSSSSSQDILLQQLLQQNQMLMQQNQQFQNNMLAAARGQGQFGATSAGTIGRVNRSNGQMLNNVNPGGTFGQNFGQSNLPQTANSGVTNGLLPGSGTLGAFSNNGAVGPVGQGNFGAGAQSSFGGIPSNVGGQGIQNPSPGIQNQSPSQQSMFGQFGGLNSGTTAGAGMSNFGASNGGMMSNQGGTAGGGSLANMFGGGAGAMGAGGGTPSGMLGGNGGAGGQSNTQGSPPAGAGGGAGNKAPDLGSLMSNIDTSALQGMLGGGGGVGMDVSSLLGNVDINAMEGLLSGEQGQDLMKSVSGMLSGPNGGNLMNAVSGMMSGNGGPADIAGLMGSMDVGELQNMAKQAEGIMASSGIDPAQILSMMG